VARSRLRRNGSYWQQLELFERNLIASAIEDAGNNWEEAARRLGISAPFLRQRGIKLGLHTPRKLTKPRNLTGKKLGAPFKEDAPSSPDVTDDG
jgi:hypothetical protein